MSEDALELEPGELLPCPFCGGKAEVIHFDEGENDGGSCVACTHCQASSNVEFGFKENFVANWNARVPAPSASGDGWQPIESAPKDGTLVDLLYPHPYGRTINCRWTDRLEIGWHWTTPKWGTNGFLIESEWMTSTHPISPTHWMPLPAPPAPIPSTASGDE